MSEQEIHLAVKGLFTNPSTFSDVPEGVLSVADNLVIDRENIATTRRGFKTYGTSATANVQTLIPYKNNKLRYLDNGVLQYDADNLGAWTSYAGAYTVPDPTDSASRIRYVESNKNLYLLTNKGTYKIDALTVAPRLAGAPQGQSGSGSVTGGSGFLLASTSVAYRVVWGYRDASNNLILGAPSERIIVSNAGGTPANVALSFQIPDEITNAWFYQVYRSPMSANLTTEPSDELQQCFEGIPTDPQLTAATVTLTDVTPESLLQQFLYTNSSQQGILQANTRPPFATDSCLYKNYTWYSNTRTIFSLQENLLSSEPTLGIQVGDTIKFTRTSDSVNFTLTGQAAESGVAGQFKVFNTGDPALDIANTAKSIAKILNVYPSNTFLNAYYISDYNAIPGQLQFEMSTMTDQGFTMNCSRETCWSPNVYATGNYAAAQNDAAVNRIYWSKELQPEAVPILNYLTVGSQNQPVDRIVALRDCIIVMKQDGVFKISGDSPANWTVTGIDTTVRIFAPNTAVALDNQVFFLSDQAVVAANDSSVEIVSHPIDRTLLKLTSPDNYPNTRGLATATIYNADHKYILAVPQNGTDTSCKQQFCYNTITRTWTRWTRNMNCGLVFIGDNKLYLGGPLVSGAANTVQERKTYTLTDFADEDYVINIIAVADNVLQLTSAANVQIGYTILQVGTSSQGIVTAIDGNYVTVDEVDNWAAGAAVAYTPISTELKSIQIQANNAGAQKHWREASFLFTETNFERMNVAFTSDLSPGKSIQVLTPQQQGSWGEADWGEFPWGGGGDSGQQRLRTLVPQQAARANFIYVDLTLSQCFTSFGLSGMSFVYNDQSTRQRD